MTVPNHGVFIGIDDYPGSGMDLSCCVNDALAWRAALGPSCESVTELHDAQATHVAIVAEVAEGLARLAGPDDWLVLQYSGHGSHVADRDGDEADRRDEVLCCHDFTNPVLDDELHRLLAGRRVGRVLFISDSCHSGTVARFAPAPLVMGSDTRVRFMDPARIGSEPQSWPASLPKTRAVFGAPSPGVVHLAACADTEYAYESGEHGAFTAAALAALPRSGTFLDWHQRVRHALPSQQFPQSPRVNASIVDARLALPFDTAALPPPVAVTGLLAAHNAVRSRRGLPLFTEDEVLKRVAQAHSEYQAKRDQVGHVGPGGSWPWDRISGAGYRWKTASENVAAGQRDAAEAVDDWMTSPGHRANVLGKYSAFGGGVAASERGTKYWTGVYATPGSGGRFVMVTERRVAAEGRHVS